MPSAVSWSSPFTFLRQNRNSNQIFQRKSRTTKNLQYNTYKKTNTYSLLLFGVELFLKHQGWPKMAGGKIEKQQLRLIRVELNIMCQKTSFLNFQTTSPLRLSSRMSSDTTLIQKHTKIEALFMTSEQDDSGQSMA